MVRPRPATRPPHARDCFRGSLFLARPFVSPIHNWSFLVAALLFALGIGAVIRAQWFGRWGADEIQVWLATDHISNERLGAYLQGPLRKMTVRRFDALPALLEALGETASANVNRQVRVALG